MRCMLEAFGNEFYLLFRFRFRCSKLENSINLCVCFYYFELLFWRLHARWNTELWQLHLIVCLTRTLFVCRFAYDIMLSSFNCILIVWYAQKPVYDFTRRVHNSGDKYIVQKFYWLLFVTSHSFNAVGKIKISHGHLISNQFLCAWSCC